MNTSLLKKVSDAFGPSGCESAVLKVIEKNIKNKVSEIYYDKAGNLIAKIDMPKSKENILFSTSVDEAGFMILNVEDNGNYKIASLGGLDGTTLYGRKVLVGNDKKTSLGIASVKAIHMQSKDERGKGIEANSIQIKSSFENKDEAIKNATAGDYGTFAPYYESIGKFVKNKALDSRVGAYILCELIDYIYTSKIRVCGNLYFSFNVKNRIGASGAQNVAFAINPTKAYVVGTSNAVDISDISSQLSCSKLGEGVAIAYADERTIFAKELVDKIISIANDLKINYQFKTLVNGGNDAMYIQKATGGTKIVSLEVPCRYRSTGSTMVSMDDVYSCLDILKQLV